METLLTIAVWGGLFFLMMRFGCGSHLMGGGHKKGQAQTPPEKIETPALRWVPAEKDVDPVCKKTIATSTAKTSVYDGKVYSFCSRDCREVFEVAPELYVEAGDADQKSVEHAHV